jgi:hypothetical protein
MKNDVGVSFDSMEKYVMNTTEKLYETVKDFSEPVMIGTSGFC